MPINLKALLNEVIVKNASDLHIGVGVPPIMRIDGHLKVVEGVGIPTGLDIERAFLEVMSKGRLDLFKASLELDFSFSYTGSDGTEARFRGNCFHEAHGMAAAFRLIPTSIRSVEELQLPMVLKEIIRKRRGLFLVTGPTGHGKSTTLAALIREINMTRFEHIITIEDPIEYVHRSERCLIHQREVGTDTSSFAEGLRRVLRQDPDVILIGELRDLETIAAAITAAETGHLVLGTLHTQDAAQSIDRLIDVFPPYQQTQIRVQLASVLLGICSQQLVPKGEAGGRVCATELLIANPAVRNCIREGKGSQIRTLIQTGVNIGMHTMEQNLAEFVKAGSLSLETALTYSYDPQDLQRILVKGA